MAEQGDSTMDAKTVEEVAKLHRQIEELKLKVDRRDERIKAIQGYLQQQLVEPGSLPA